MRKFFKIIWSGRYKKDQTIILLKKLIQKKYITLVNIETKEQMDDFELIKKKLFTFPAPFLFDRKYGILIHPKYTGDLIKN